MYPRLLTTPYFTVHTFGVLLAASYVTAIWWVARGARREGLDSERALSLCFWAIGGALLGAKLLLVLRTLPEYTADPSRLFSASLLQSAGDFYGGFLGALAAVALFFWRNPRLPVWQTADLCGPAIALGQTIGRLACFAAGDDYGRPSTLPWAVTFTDPEAGRIGGAPLGVPLHPVQLYESAACLAIFLGLVWLVRRKRFYGEVILAYALLYGLARFVIEYFRGDLDRGFVLDGLFSTSQVIAVSVVAVAGALYAARFTSGRRPVAPAGE